MFKTHSDGFVSQYAQDVFSVGIEQFKGFYADGSISDAWAKFADYDFAVGDYVVVSMVALDDGVCSQVFLDGVGSFERCISWACQRACLPVMDGRYQYEVWQLCDDGDLWQGWELSCLSVDRVATETVPYAVREQGAWVYALLRAKWHSGNVHGDCYALIFKDGAVFARSDWHGYAFDGVDDACESFCQGGWDCLGFVNWHSCYVDVNSDLYCWESTVLDWLRLYGLEISWHDAQLRDEREARIESTAEFVA